MHLTRVLLLFYCVLLLIGCGEKPDNRPWVFQATYDVGVGGCSLLFREDSTCEWLSGMFSEEQEGTYHIQDSIITLENIPMGGCLKSNYLLMTDINPNQQVHGDKILVQIDKQLHIVDSHFIFTIYGNQNSPRAPHKIDLPKSTSIKSERVLN